MKRWALVLAIGLAAAASALALAADKPFPGRYELTGAPAKLLAGEKITLTQYASPTCAQCYLFHREMKKPGKPLGADVAISRIYVYHPEGGKAPVRLLLLARQASPEKERELLAALFEAAFEKKVSIEDDDVLTALAQAHGLGEMWKDKAQQAKVDAECAKLDKLFAAMGGPPKTPLLVINDVVAISPGYSKAQGDELPAILQETLDQVRAYRKAHGK